MKISWGTGIVLALAAFISFILFLVISMTTNKELDHDLVVEEYYQKELEFQEQLDNERNARRLPRSFPGGFRHRKDQRKNVPIQAIEQAAGF